jgi:hypothetical protein
LTGSESIVAFYLANKRQAEFMRDRAKRRAGQRHRDFTLQLTSYLPHLRPGIDVELEETPVRVRDPDTGSVTTVGLLSGVFFISGHRHVKQVSDDGRGSLLTQVYLRSQF